MDLHIALLQVQRLAERGTHHLLNEIDAGDQFGHGMLDLQAGVHLEEVEVPVLVDDELDRTGAVVLNRPGQRDRLLTHRLAGLGVQERRRRLLDDLLVTALNGALALVEVDDVAVLVPEHLDLDMAGLGHELFDEYAIIAKAVAGFGLGGREALLHVLAVPGDAHALAATAGGSLHHHRIADLFGDLDRVRDTLDDADVARDRRDLGGVGELLGFDLVAHRINGVGVRSDEDEARLGALPGEARLFGQEPEARMDRLGAGGLGRCDDLLGDQIAFRRRGRADQDSLVSKLHRKAVGVGLGIDHHRFDPEASRRFDDAHGDFAAIGDQDLFEHRLKVLASPGQPYRMRSIRPPCELDGLCGDGNHDAAPAS